MTKAETRESPGKKFKPESANGYSDMAKVTLLQGAEEDLQ